MPFPLYAPVLPNATSQIAAASNEDECAARVREMLANYLPAAHVDVLHQLLPFLNTVAAHSSVNKMPASNLALVFAPALLRRAPLEVSQRAEGRGAEE